MNNEALLDLYMKKLRLLAEEKLKEKEISVIDALKISLNYLEGEMQGY